mgnify:CR=1 FL=1
MYTTFYDHIIVGGTYGAIGFYAGNTGNNLIISKNIYIEDHSPAFRFGKTSYRTKAGEILYKKLEIQNGIANTAQASIEMYKIADIENWNILYQTFVSSIEKYEDGWRVTAHNWDGTSMINCKNVIHTQPVGKIERKTFNALVEGDVLTGVYIGYSISDAFHTGQKVLKLNVGVNDTMDTARLNLLKLIHNDELKNLRLILTATEFDYQVSGWDINEIPSCNYENLIESFEKGYEIGAAL